MSLRLEDYSVRESVITQDHTTAPEASHDWTKWLHKDIQLFSSGFGLKKKEALYAYMAVLLSAGLDIQKALELIEKNLKQQKDKDLIIQIRETIVQGAAFSEALDQAGQFSAYEVFSIQIGEESGQIIPVFEELATFFEKSLKFRSQLVSALAYPSFVIGFASLVVYFLLNYLVPMFSDVYDRFDKELPAITQTIMQLSDWTREYAIYCFLGIALVGITLYTQRQKIWFRKIVSAILLRIPIFGAIIRQLYLARLSQSMFLLMNAHVPLLKAVELVRKMVGFYPIEESLQQAEQDILQGQQLHESLSNYSFYPASFIALLQVGEESSTLNRMFKKLSEQNSNEVEQKTATIGSLMEPILIIALGIIVGFILVAMYMPLFQMSVGAGG